jgi:integrase
MVKNGRQQYGTVRKLPSGRWQARLWLGDGRRIPADRTFATKTDANLWVASQRTKAAAGRPDDPERARVSLADYARSWLAQQGHLAPRTVEIYRNQLERHILPEVDDSIVSLGDLSLNELTPEVIRSWYQVLVVNRSKSTAAKAYVRLRQILNQAVDDERILRNPCRIRRGGVERHEEQRFATMPELLEIAALAPERYQVLILTAGLGGLRQGELFGLRRRDLDLEKGVVRVRRKRLRLDSGQVIENETKSGAGQRTVALPEQLIEELRTHMEEFTEKDATAYVFTSETGQPIDRNNFRKRIWIPIATAVGLEDLRFHDLRHTAGTLAARTGATTKELMVRLGHSSPNASLVYQHASADRDQRIADGLTKLFRKAEGKKSRRKGARSDGGGRSRGGRRPSEDM